MAQLEQMGGMQEILSMMPGMASQMKNVEIDENAAKTPKAIVQSMTPRERSLQDSDIAVKKEAYRRWSRCPDSRCESLP